MVLKSKTLFFTFLLAFISGAATVILYASPEPAMLLQEDEGMVDQTQDISGNKSFSISNGSLDSYEDVLQKSPLDAPMPDNVKTTVEYDVHSGNYVMRTVGEMEIATFYHDRREYADFSAKTNFRIIE